LDWLRLGGGLRPAIAVVAIKIREKNTYISTEVVIFCIFCFAAPQPTTDGMYFCA